MRIEIDYLEEPTLQFGEHFEHQDTKTGLAEYGPFGKNAPGLHVPEIRLGFIGTRETISKAKEWIERCSGFIESENIEKIKQKASADLGTLFGEPIEFDAPELYRLDKILNRDFIGFNQASAFECSFQMNPRWERSIDYRQLKTILDVADKEKRILY